MGLASIRNGLILAIFTIAGCGGGGGAGDSGGNAPPGSSVPPPEQPVAPEPRSAITAAQAGNYSGVFLQQLVLGRQYADDLLADVTLAHEPGENEFEVECEHGGRVRSELSNGRLTRTQTFDNCRVDVDGLTQTYNGVVRVDYTSRPGFGPFESTLTFEGLSISINSSYRETIRGTLVYVSEDRPAYPHRDRITWDLSYESTGFGVIRLVDLSYEYDYTVEFRDHLVGLVAAAGGISHDDHGRVDVTFVPATGTVELAGSGEARARLAILEGRNITTYHPTATDSATAYGRLADGHITEIPFFGAGAGSPPEQHRAEIPDLDAGYIMTGDTRSFSLRDVFFDPDGDLMTVETELLSLESYDRGGYHTDWAPVDAAAHFEIVQPEAGLFEFRSSLDEQYASYRFRAYATDTYDLVTTEPLIFTVDVFRDSDGDGEPDTDDDDDDNDGVPDYMDDYPLDASEWADSDGDGVGNNTDTDDDNDGVADVDDFYSTDHRCHAESDGDGSSCWFTLLNRRINYEIDGDGIVYLYDFDGYVLPPHEVLRFDSVTGHFLDSMTLSPASFGLDPAEADYSIRYQANHDALFVSYDDALVTRIDPAAPELGESPFHYMEETSIGVYGAIGFGSWLAVREAPSIYERTWFSYDGSGTLVDSIAYDLNESPGDMRPPELAEFCSVGYSVSLATGTFFGFQNTGKYDCDSGPVPVVSPDGQEFLLITGEIFDVDMTLLRTIQMEGFEGSAWVRGIWTRDGLWQWNGLFSSADGSRIYTVVPPEDEQDRYTIEFLVEGDNVVFLFLAYGAINIERWEGL